MKYLSKATGGSTALAAASPGTTPRIDVTMPTEGTAVPRSRLAEAAAVAVGALTLATSLAACGQPPEVATTPCPAKNQASYTAIDLSDSARDAGLLADRLALVQGSLTETAVCSGTARVVAFSNSEAATAVLFDADLKPEGATDQARRRRAPRLVDGAMAEVQSTSTGPRPRCPAEAPTWWPSSV